MKSSTLILAFGACALLGAGTAALAQEDNDSYILQITKVGVKIGHDTAFQEAVKAYHACLLEHEDAGTWSTWSNVGGDGREYHFVSTMDNWAEMDSPWEAGKACWPEHEKEITPNVESVSTRFARPMADWSADADGYTVVRLHQFRVDDGEAFRDAVGAITGIMKEAEYAHMGSWYNVIGNSSNEPGYFVVAHYDNFAAIDEDRAGPYQAVADAAGEERADELWKQFGDSLRDDREYFTELLRREDDLSHLGEE